MSDVVITGRADLDSILKQLQDMNEQMKQVQDSLQKTGKKGDAVLAKSAENTKRNITTTGGALRRMVNSLFDDMKALVSLNAVSGALKLSSQFSSAIKESLALSDTIRRLGTSFGVSKDKFGDFQASLAKGLGDIGASSEAAAMALEGLAGYGVKGGDSAQALATGAVTLAGMSGEKGNEKGIASLLAKAIQSQGKNVNDASAQSKLIGEVTAATQATGKSASEILSAMDAIFSTMDKSMRSQIGPEAMAQMATVAATVGPDATKAFQEYLGKSSIERTGMEAQGVDFFGKDGGLDMKKLQSFISGAQERIGMDPRKALETFGFSGEAAEGLVRIGEQAETVKGNLDALAGATRDNVEAFRRSMGFVDSFKGAINTVKGNLEQFGKGTTQFATDLLQSQVGDAAGSTAVVAGGGLLAALMAGGGLRGIGGMLGGMASGRLSKAAQESITGEKVQDVYVTNAAEISGGLAGKMAGAGGMGMMGKVGMVGAAAAAGVGIGSLLEPIINEKTQGTTSEGFEGNAIERLIFKLDKLVGGEASGRIMEANSKMAVKVTVDSKDPNLKATSKPGRGSGQ